MSSNLSTKLREGTKKAHTMAENTGFVACFLKGTVEPTSYRKLVANLYYVYSAMEDEMYRHREHPMLGKMYFPELNRRASLEQDLAYYFGSNWKDVAVASEAAQDYVNRIHEIGNTEPELLISHLYTRYMGDLSGGQILKKIAQNAMGLSENKGLAFYEFEQIPDEKEFKRVYRERLDALPIDAATGDRIVEEANDAFGLNMNMFKELEGNLIKAIGIQLFSLLTRKRNRGSTTLATAD